jgi:hypothetical protein
MTGAISSNKAGGFQRQIFITTERGEKLALMLFSERVDDLCARWTDALFPAHETERETDMNECELISPQDFPHIPSQSGLAAMRLAYKRIARDGYPHLCPVRIGKPFGPAIETAILKKLTAQGFCDGASSPQLTKLGIEYIEQVGVTD